MVEGRRSTPARPILLSSALLVAGFWMFLSNGAMTQIDGYWEKVSADIYNTNTSGNVNVKGTGTLISERTLSTGQDVTTPQASIQAVLTGANGGSVQVGGGPSLLFRADDSTNTKESLGRVSALWRNRTNGAEEGSLVFSVRANAGDATASTERMRIRADGNVGIGHSDPPTKLCVAGDVTVTGNIAAKYQDLAEWVPARFKLPAGTVVVIDPINPNHVVASSTPYDTRVAGVISEQPGVILGESGKDRLMVATIGRVRVKVDATKAPVRVGDLLVTSDEPGLAMRSKPLQISGAELHRPGTVIGKALEPLTQGRGAVLVLLGLQ